MSLRGRVIALVALMLMISVSLYVAISWTSARSDLAAELSAARTGGLQTVRSAFEDLPRSDHPQRDLRQLVATFDGNRHLTAAVLDRIWARSIVVTPGDASESGTSLVRSFPSSRPHSGDGGSS